MLNQIHKILFKCMDMMRMRTCDTNAHACAWLCIMHTLENWAKQTSTRGIMRVRYSKTLTCNYSRMPQIQLIFMNTHIDNYR